MKLACVILLVLPLTGCVRQEPNREEGFRTECLRCLHSASAPAPPPSTPLFDNLPIQWRQKMLQQLDNTVDWEQVTVMGKDHLGRTVRAVEPRRCCWHSINVAILADEVPLGLLDVESVQAGYDHDFDLLVWEGNKTFLSIVSKSMSGTGIWFFTRKLFELTETATRPVLCLPAWGHLCGWGFPDCQNYSCDIRFESSSSPILACDWQLDIDEGLIEISGTCRYLWNANTNEFYPEDRGEGERLGSLGWDGEDQLVIHHFPALRTWAKAKGKHASDWLLKLRQGCKLESSRVLIDLILG